MILFVLLILSQERGLESFDDAQPRDSADVVRYTATSIIYDLEKSIIVLKDSSSIVYKDITLLSDSAYYHIDNNQLEAFGECYLKQADDSIKGDYLRYNIENKKALMTNGKTQIEKGFLEGRDIYWIDEHTINAYAGKYTTCSDTPPHYYFYSPKMKVYLGDMVIARPIFLYIHGFPVAAAPFWFVPISSKRKSGLLPFRAGNSRTFGKYVRGFAYYLVISDYADITLQIDAMEKKGIMPHIEGVWNFAPYSKGSIYGSYIRDNETKRERYSLEARNSSDYFLFGSSFNFDINYLSDNTYQQDYAETTLLQLQKEITSQANISRNIAGFKNSLSYERVEKFIDTVATSISEKFPFYTLSVPSSMLLSSINYSLSGHVNRIRLAHEQESREVTGANVHTTPSMQRSVLNLLTISPRADLDLAIFDQDTAGIKLPTRLGYSFGVTASTNFYRVFNVGFLGIHGILHKVLPKLSYSYTPDFAFGRFPTVDGIPTFSHTNRIGFGIDQVFEAKIGKEQKKKIIAQVALNSGYSFISDSISEVSFSLEFPFNPFPKPLVGFASKLDGFIDPYTQEYTYTIANNTSLESEFFSLDVNQSYTKNGVYQIWLSGNIKPTRNWSVSYSGRYDWQEKKLVDYGFRLHRDMHCWEAILNFSQLGDSWRYDFKIRIKAIPDVEIGKGLLGYIVE